MALRSRGRGKGKVSKSRVLWGDYDIVRKVPRKKIVKQVTVHVHVEKPRVHFPETWLWDINILP